MKDLYRSQPEAQINFVHNNTHRLISLYIYIYIYTQALKMPVNIYFCGYIFIGAGAQKFG